MSDDSKLAQKEYKRRHDNVARMVNCKLHEKFNAKKYEKWYLNNPQTISENVYQKLIWDMTLQLWKGDQMLLL